MFIKSANHHDRLLNIDKITQIKKVSFCRACYIYFYTDLKDSPYTTWEYTTEQERDKAFESLEDDLIELGKLKIIY